jgi:hypothetical protein
VKFRIGDLCVMPLSIYEFRDNWFNEINSSFKDIKILPDFLNVYPTGKKVWHRRCLGTGLHLSAVCKLKFIPVRARYLFLLKTPRSAVEPT